MDWNNIEPDFFTYSLGDLFLNSSIIETIHFLDRLQKGLTIVIDSNIISEIYTHVLSRYTELGGILIGRVYLSDYKDIKIKSPLVLIKQIVRSKEFESTGVSLRIGTSIWDEVKKVTSKTDYVIGWYHSHPNLGAFFSQTDRRTQSAFFNQNYNVGLVVDPYKHDEKWFAGKESNEVSPIQIVVINRNM